MGVISTNKYIFFNTKRSTRHWIITKDAKFESTFVKECTKIALESDKLDKPLGLDQIDDDFSFRT